MLEKVSPSLQQKLTAVSLASFHWLTASKLFGATCSGVTISFDVKCDNNGNPIYSYLRAIIKFLSAGVGLAVLLMIIIGAVQYISSSGNPQALAAARKRIANAVIALFLFIFMVAILNFLVPGEIIF